MSKLCYTFCVPGKPKSKQRPRFYNGVAVTPKQTVNYENWVKTCFYQNYPVHPEPTDKPLDVHITAYFIKPKSNKNNHPTTVRLDCDNIAKIILDSLNGIAYKDDKQVISLEISKKWGDKEEVWVCIDEVAHE